MMSKFLVLGMFIFTAIAGFFFAFALMLFDWKFLLCGILACCAWYILFRSYCKIAVE